MAVTDDERDRRYFFARSNYLVKKFFQIQSDAHARYENLLGRSGFSRVARMVREARQTSDSLDDALHRSFYQAFRNFKQRSGFIASRLSALSPLHTMARGYSIVTNTRGNVIKNASQITKGDSVDIRFFTGRATAEVKDIR